MYMGTTQSNIGYAELTNRESSGFEKIRRGISIATIYSEESSSLDVLEVLGYVKTVSTVAIHIKTERNFQPRMIHYCPLIFVPLPNMAATIYTHVNYSLFQ